MFIKSEGIYDRYKQNKLKFKQKGEMIYYEKNHEQRQQRFLID